MKKLSLVIYNKNNLNLIHFNNLNLNLNLIPLNYYSPSFVSSNSSSSFFAFNAWPPLKPIVLPRVIYLVKKQTEKVFRLLPEKISTFVTMDLSFCYNGGGVWIDKQIVLSKYNLSEIYSKIFNITEYIKNIDNGKGYINRIDFREYPVFKDFLNIFVTNDKDLEKISLNEYSQIYHWIFNTLYINLYDLTIYINEKGIFGESYKDLKTNFLILEEEIFGFLDPTIRKRIKKGSLSFNKEIITGFDTEYKNIDFKLNSLLSVQLAINAQIILKIPTPSWYKLSSLNTDTNKEFLKVTPKTSSFNYDLIEKSINKSLFSIRHTKYSDYDFIINKLISKLRYAKINHFLKDSNYFFEFPKTGTIPFIYFNIDNKGICFKDLVKISNSLVEPLLLKNWKKVYNLVFGKDTLINFDKEIIQNFIECNRIEELPVYNYNYKRYQFLHKGTKGLKRTIRYSVNRTNYFYAHFTNADLCMLNDFDLLKENLNIVHSSLVTLGKGFCIDNTKVFIRDTMLLAPAGKRRLSDIGSLHGFNKLVLPFDYINNMDILLENNKKIFTEYALRDALICLIHANYIKKFNFSLNNNGIPMTLASLGVKYLNDLWEKSSYKGFQVHPEFLLGCSEKTVTPKGIHFVNKDSNMLVNKLPFYIGNYKGGRNESFMYGKNSKTVFYDYDLISAYTTVMAFLGNPVYSKAEEYDEEWLGNQDYRSLLYSYIIMEVSFEFPKDIKYPSIPVYIDKTSTVYPLKGKAYLTGSEYLVAKNQGCDMTIFNIYKIPFEGNTFNENPQKQGLDFYEPTITKINIEEEKGVWSEKYQEFINQPYLEILREVQSKRRQFPKGTIENLLYKEMGNGMYGQTVKGIAGKMNYDIPTRMTQRMQPSQLTNPIIASWITAFVRSVIAECLHNIKILGGNVVSVTTDGFITDIKNLENNILDKCDCPLLKEYQNMRKNLCGETESLELKHQGEGIISWTTRGQFSKNACIKATTGLQLKTINEISEELLNDAFETDNKCIHYIQNSLTNVKDLILRKNLHIVPIFRDITFRMKFDNRRKIADNHIKNEEVFIKGPQKTFEDLWTGDILKSPWDFLMDKPFPEKIDGLLDSLPWENVEECVIARKISKIGITKPFHMYTSTPSKNKYNSNDLLIVRNFVKILYNERSRIRYGINWNILHYQDILDFLMKYKTAYKRITLKSIGATALRFTKGVIMDKQIPRNDETQSFVDFLKRQECTKDFREDLFFK